MMLADTVTISEREYEDLIRLKNTIYDRLGLFDADDVRRWINRALAVGERVRELESRNWCVAQPPGKPDAFDPARRTAMMELDKAVREYVHNYYVLLGAEWDPSH